MGKKKGGIMICMYNVGGFPLFLHAHQHVIPSLLDVGHPNWYEVISNCGFNLHFPDD